LELASVSEIWSEKRILKHEWFPEGRLTKAGPIELLSVGTEWMLDGAQKAIEKSVYKKFWPFIGRLIPLTVWG